MRYRAPLPADAPAVLAVFEARDIADLGEVEQTLEELIDEWQGSDLDLSRNARVVEDPDGRIVAAGFRLRSINPAEDAVAVHAVDAASFASAPDYTPESLREFTDEHFGAYDFDPAISRLAVEGDRTVGFLIAGHRPQEAVGYVHILAVVPERQDRGLGTSMLQSAFAAFAEARIREVRLGVASYNPRALHVYERLGMIERFRFDIYERPVDRLAAYDEPM
jgi:ribosomal protein S18 acetylase RimI-like enzyme